MNDRLRPEIVELARWLEAQCERHAFGSFGITITLHGNRITRIERHAIESLKPGQPEHGEISGRRNL